MLDVVSLSTDKSICHKIIGSPRPRTQQDFPSALLKLSLYKNFSLPVSELCFLLCRCHCIQKEAKEMTYAHFSCVEYCLLRRACRMTAVVAVLCVVMLVL